MVANLTGEGLASNVVYKEMFLTLQDTKPLHSEQKAHHPSPAACDLACSRKRDIGAGPTVSWFHG